MKNQKENESSNELVTLDERIINLAKRINSYIQGNGSSKKLKKKSESCTKKICESK